MRTGRAVAPPPEPYPAKGRDFNPSTRSQIQNRLARFNGRRPPVAPCHVPPWPGEMSYCSRDTQRGRERPATRSGASPFRHAQQDTTGPGAPAAQPSGGLAACPSRFEPGVRDRRRLSKAGPKFWLCAVHVRSQPDTRDAVLAQVVCIGLGATIGALGTQRPLLGQRRPRYSGHTGHAAEPGARSLEIWVLDSTKQFTGLQADPERLP